MICVLDTNVIADLIVNIEPVVASFERAIINQDRLILPHAVYYEVQRGLKWRQATRKEQIFEEQIIPRLNLTEITLDDWQQAANYWALAVSQGKQLSDVDLMIAALTKRLDAILVTSDKDFDLLPIQRINWRLAV